MALSDLNCHRCHGTCSRLCTCVCHDVAVTKGNDKAGYHLRPIQTRGVFGDPSKIREELEELEEAFEQENRILALCELADIYGALEGVAEKLGVGMADVAKMAEATKRAFKSGQRKAK